MLNKVVVLYLLLSISRFGREKVARRSGIILNLMVKEILKPGTQLVQYLRARSGVCFLNQVFLISFGYNTNLNTIHLSYNLILSLPHNVLVANKWLHERGQEFYRPCTLENQETDEVDIRH